MPVIAVGHSTRSHASGTYLRSRLRQRSGSRFGLAALATDRRGRADRGRLLGGRRARTLAHTRTAAGRVALATERRSARGAAARTDTLLVGHPAGRIAGAPRRRAWRRRPARHGVELVREQRVRGPARCRTRAAIQRTLPAAR